MDWLRKNYDQTKREFTLTAGMDSFGRPLQSLSDLFIIFVFSLMKVYIEDYKSIVNDILAKYETMTGTYDCYNRAFVGLVYINLGKVTEANTIADKLISYQDSDSGAFEKEVSTITMSRGMSKTLEATALALLLLMEVDSTKFNKQIEKGINFVLGNMQMGYFSSTQATILCLKAIVKYSELLSTKNKGIKEFEVFIDEIMKNYNFETTDDNDKEFPVISFEELKNTQKTSLDVKFKPKFTLVDEEKFVLSVNYK